MPTQIDTVRQITRQFCQEFIRNPYLCYTEHGLHALFFTKLYSALPPDQRYTNWEGHRVCVIQKEYPTAGRLGRPRRQNWDIAVIKTPPESVDGMTPSYDYLKLAAAVELGINEPEAHLKEDIRRLCHCDANVEQGFIIHLYRLCEPGAKVSGRDWSANSRRILCKGNVVRIAEETAAKKHVEILYGMCDSTGKHESGLWLIEEGVAALLK